MREGWPRSPCESAAGDDARSCLLAVALPVRGRYIKGCGGRTWDAMKHNEECSLREVSAPVLGAQGLRPAVCIEVMAGSWRIPFLMDWSMRSMKENKDISCSHLLVQREEACLLS